MKPPYLLLYAVLLCFTSCIRKSSDYQTTYYPVMMTREALEKSVSFHPAAPIDTPSKVYYQSNYILILQQGKGVHVIDNSTPSRPVNRGYISIPGCLDVAIKDNTLYANNAVDIVAIDLSNIGSSTVTVAKRVKNIFNEMSSPDEKSLPDEFSVANRPPNSVIVGWEK
ncbi:hypothetical protein C8P68_105348 [Mucilaginibacter yixingensis]|uniref:LVIVD repeat-containing protein n=1 Tax=Mucilaginibacter yixingensis TaxID=1295612 RepID=A0A2T5J8Q0_9SPHI|nr:hypothetical protein [Mucilaginibacter yixingensis]PTQ95837.1 hypothetical protein C8P68_105348 [Mucilaginibacter yixingensis]